MNLNLYNKYGGHRHALHKFLLVMKLIIILITTAILQVSASTYAQKITLNRTNVPLEKVMKEIRQQSGYDFFYDLKLIKNTKPISINVKDASLEEVLDKCFANQPLTYKIGDMVVMIKEKEKPVLDKVKSFLNIPVTVSGKVTDTTGTPLQGTTIAVKGKNLTVVTNDKGEFAINAELGDQLVISFIGYVSQTITATDNPPFQNIILHAMSNNLDEVAVVSTGYQDIPQERITGSFELISKEQINRRVTTDILSRLDGTSSILFDKRNPAAQSLQIRGLYTLTEGISQPLIVLDNFPYQGDVGSINPNDIESITLLKDAAAASIWGARAGNGVIVITTKKARYNQRLNVSFNSSITVTAKPDLSKLPVIPTSDFIDFQIRMFNQGMYDARINDTYSYPALTGVEEILNNRRLGIISGTDSTSQINALRGNDVRNDFTKYVYRTKVTQQHQADVSGGNDKANFRLSAGYDKNLYNLIGNDYSRYTFNSYTTLQPSKYIQLQAGLQYVQSTSTNNSLGDYGSGAYDLENSLSYGSGATLPVYSRLADNKGNHLNINKYRQSYLDTTGHGKLLNWNFNPLDELSNNDNTAVARTFLADAGLRISPFKSLSVDVKYRYQRAATTASNNRNLESFYARDLINLYTNLNTTESAKQYPVPLGGILSTSESAIETHNVRGQLNFNEDITKDSRLSAIAGAEINQTVNRTSDNITYGYNSRLNVATVDFLNPYPQQLGYEAIIPYPVAYVRKNNRYVSVFANAAYTFNNRYVLSASARNDATNLFGIETRNRWKPLYSFGGSWNISDEPFYQLKAVPFLRLRATYGYQGNVNNIGSAYSLISYFPAADNYPVNLPAAYVYAPGNPSLRWETVRQINLASDFEILGGRIKGSVDYYWKKSTDVLTYATADQTTGFSLVLKNSANLKGNGFELSLNTLNIVTKDFQWRTNFLLNHASYKVTRYLLNNTNNGLVSDGAVINPLVGQSPYAVISYKFAGLDHDTGDPIGYVNGQQSKDWDNIVYNTPLADQSFAGSALPLYYGNLYNDFTYKDFHIAFNVVYKLNYFFRRPTINYGILFSNGYGNSDYLKRWQKPGDENQTTVPSMVYPNPTSSRDVFYNYSEATVEKGDHFKLQTVQLGYKLLKVIPQKISLTQLELFANADNLNFILWRTNKNGIDPDYPSGLKPGRSFTIGLRAGF